MALIQTLHYNIRSSQNEAATNETKSLYLKTSECNPKYLIHKATVIGDTHKRQGTASCKTRSEVRGGGKKPWKQKGTGRARSGSSNSPLWRGGGVSFGPKPKSYDKKINDKEKQLAVSTALYHNSHKLIVIDDVLDVISKPNTKQVLNILEKITSIHKNTRTLVVIDHTNENLSLSLRNVANLDLITSNTLNLRDLLLAHTIIITEKALFTVKNITQS